MSMNTKSGDSGDDIVAEINMTPLIDIMLVLLIIFMLSTTAALESGLDVDLPKSSSTSVKGEEPKIVVISLDQRGRLAVQGKKIRPEDLQESLRLNLIDLKTDTVILEGDHQSQLGRVVEIMDIAKNAGAKTFSIAAEKTNFRNAEKEDKGKS